MLLSANFNRPNNQANLGGNTIRAFSLTDVLDDFRTAEEGLHKFERRYWISSEQFFQLYEEGALDDGEHLEDFAEWAEHYRLRRKRQMAFEEYRQ